MTKKISIVIFFCISVIGFLNCEAYSNKEELNQQKESFSEEKKNFPKMASSKEYYRKIYTVKDGTNNCIDIFQAVPECATVGFPYPIEIMLKAKKSCSDIIVTQQIPQNVGFVGCEPLVKPGFDKKLVWYIEALDKGSEYKITVWVQPDKEGEYLSFASVYAVPQLCVTTQCEESLLSVKQTVVKDSSLHSPIKFSVEVENTGSALARNVVVENPVPVGMEHFSGQQVLSFNLGDMEPGEKKNYNVEFQTNKVGLYTNRVFVNFCGGDQTVSQASTLIKESKISIDITGSREGVISKGEEYIITLTNFSNITVYDVDLNMPSKEVEILSAEGANISFENVSWRVPQILAGESLDFKVCLKSKNVGSLLNKILVSSKTVFGNCSSQAELLTKWRGIPSTQVTVLGISEPAVCIGETMTYHIRVKNQGSAEDTNVNIAINFSEGLQPLSSEGPVKGSVSENQIVFDTIPSLNPDRTLDFVITLRAIKEGEAKGEVILSSDSLKEKKLG